MTTRERKIKFIEAAGDGNLRRAVYREFNRIGPDFLTDEQLDLIVMREVQFERARQRLNRANRARMEAAE